MKYGQPFGRALAMAAAVAAIMSSASTVTHIQQAKLAELGPYVSRGKGQGRSNRIAPGAQMANIRAARKARNIRRHRARKGA